VPQVIQLRALTFEEQFDKRMKPFATIYPTPQGGTHEI
jgi:hypothetical protein